VLLVGLMYTRIALYKSILILANQALEHIFVWRSVIIDRIMEITNIRVVLFIRGGRLNRLAKAFEYIAKNESSRNITVVRLYQHLNEVEEEETKKSLKIMEELYPDFKVSYISREGVFGPAVVEAISQELKVPKNNIFIGAPEQKHRFSIEELGGVRVIF